MKQCTPVAQPPAPAPGSTPAVSQALAERRQWLRLVQTAQLAALSELAAQIAHEINQPLTAIINYSTACLYALQAGQPIPQLKDWLENINQQAKRAAQVVQQTGHSRGKDQASYTSIELQALLHEVNLFMEVEARAQRVSIEVSACAGWVMADKQLLEHALISLIRNAIEALAGIDRVERRIWIVAERRENAILVTVRDNGPGISEEFGDRLFKPFATTKTNGLGMDLAISRSIIRSHGGNLSLSSPPGQGAVFTFSLPLASNDEHGASI